MPAMDKETKKLRMKITTWTKIATINMTAKNDETASLNTCKWTKKWCDKLIAMNKETASLDIGNE